MFCLFVCFNGVLSFSLIVSLRYPLDSTLDPLWSQWTASLCHKEKMTMGTSVWRAKTVPASSAALRTAKLGHGGKGGSTYALPKLIPIHEYFSQPLLLCSIWFIGLGIFTYKFYLLRKITKSLTKSNIIYCTSVTWSLNLKFTKTNH